MENASILLRQAEQKIADGNYAEARAILKNVLAHDSKNAQAWYLVSRTVTDAKQKSEALRRALAIDPQHSAAKTTMQRLFSTTALELPTSPQQTVKKNGSGRTAPPLLLLVGMVIVILALLGLMALNRPSTAIGGTADSQINAAILATLSPFMAATTTPDPTELTRTVIWQTYMAQSSQTRQAEGNLFATNEARQATSAVLGKTQIARLPRNQTITAAAAIDTAIQGQAAQFVVVGQIWDGNALENGTTRYPLSLQIISIDGAHFVAHLTWPTFNNTITSAEGEFVVDTTNENDTNMFKKIVGFSSNPSPLKLKFKEVRLVQGDGVKTGTTYYALIIDAKTLNGTWSTAGSTGTFMLVLKP